MSKASPKFRHLAQRIIAFETRDHHSFETKIQVAFRVSETLRPRLVMLMGRSGFHSLIARGLVLATAEAPSLRAVLVNAEGALEGFSTPETHVNPSEFDEGAVVLLAQLLGLLVAFIGEILTLQFL